MIYAKHNAADPYVTLPSCQDGECITGIGAKAFLSHKEIHKLTLPPTVEHIDDWAFAHMHKLQELVLPAQHIRFGKQVFLDCSSLRRIHVLPDASGNPGLPFFLASVVTVFSDMDLLDPARAAGMDTHEAWMGTYDKRLCRYLTTDDSAGFEPVFYGWFNDEDADTAQRPAYLKKQRKNKVCLTFLRLKYDLYLSDVDRKILQDYLHAHMPWGEKAAEHTAVWDLLPTHFADDVCYCRILENAGILNPETIPLLIGHLQEASPETIAYLLRCQEKSTQFSDFFENFSL